MHGVVRGAGLLLLALALASPGAAAPKKKGGKPAAHQSQSQGATAKSGKRHAPVMTKKQKQCRDRKQCSMDARKRCDPCRGV